MKKKKKRKEKSRVEKANKEKRPAPAFLRAGVLVHYTSNCMVGKDLSQDFQSLHPLVWPPVFCMGPWGISPGNVGLTDTEGVIQNQRRDTKSRISPGRPWDFEKCKKQSLFFGEIAGYTEKTSGPDEGIGRTRQFRIGEGWPCHE